MVVGLGVSMCVVQCWSTVVVGASGGFVWSKGRVVVVRPCVCKLFGKSAR